VHVVVALAQTWPGLHQKPPALLPGQHGSPVPPQPAHVVPLHAVNGAVHSKVPPQHAWLGPPQAPPPQEPCLHVPCPPPHAPPLETQLFVFWSQQPPPPHHTPSQQGCPPPPHAPHLLFDALHACPERTQKLAPTPSPPISPGQHGWPSPPQAPQLVPVHAPSAPHVCPIITQAPPTQQRLPVQVELSQHGWPGPPQVASAPSMHTVPPPAGD
jgi:hypothetical protein